MGFKKSNFRSKSLGVSARFYQKSPIFSKNWPKLHISLSWPTYYGSVVPNDLIYVFLRVLEKSNFRSKSIGVSLPFYQKFPVCGKNWLRLCISLSWNPYSGSVVPNSQENEFLRVLKNSNICSISIGVSPWFHRKSTAWGKNWSKLCISLLWLPYSGLVVPNRLI
jgi:hypothetical protein